MGNEMGNNNTSAIKEEDNISETEKKTFQEETGKLENGMSQDIHEDSAKQLKEEIQNVPTSTTKDVVENVSEASADITNEIGKDTWQEEGHAEDLKERTQTISAAEAQVEDILEKDIGIASNHTTSMLENGSTEGDTHASYVNMENQMLPTAEAEGVQEKAEGLVSEDATTELGKVTLQEDSHEDYEKEKMQMIPTEEAKDVHEEAAGLNSNSAASMLENEFLGGDTCKSDMNMENKMHPTAEVEDVQEKATEMVSDYTRSLLENDLLKGDAPHDNVNVDHQKHQTVEGKVDAKQIAARLDFDDKTSEFEDKPQEGKQDGNVTSPTSSSIDVQGKTIITASNAPSNSTNSVDGSGDEVTKVRKPEKSPNNGYNEAKGGDFEGLTRSSFEGTEEYEVQENSFLREHLLVTYNHELNDEPSIQQGDEITEVRQHAKSSNDGPIEAKGENSESLSSSSLKGTEEYEKKDESCLREHLLVTYNHHLNIEPSIQQGDEITKLWQSEKSSNDGSVEIEGENSESLSSSSLEGTEEYEKKEETHLREHLLVTCNNHLNNEPSIQQGDETTQVIQPEKSLNDGPIEAELGNSESLSSSSLEGIEESEKQEESGSGEHLNSRPSIQKGNETTEVKHPEKSPNDGSVEAEGGNSESLSTSSLEGTKESEKQEESGLREHLNNDLSLQKGNETTEVRHSGKSPNDGSVEAEGGNSESLSSSSLEGTEESEKQEESGLTEHLNSDPSVQMGNETTEVRQPEKSPNNNSESLSSSSFQGTEEYEKQEELCLRVNLLRFKHHFNNEPSIQQDEMGTKVLKLNAANVSNNVEIQESSSGNSDHDERDKFPSDQSFLVTESLLEVNLLDTNSHSEQIKDDGLEKEMESHEKLCTDMSDGKDTNEFGSSLIDTSGTPPSIDNNNNGNSMTKVNCTTKDSLTSLFESSTVDNPLKFDHEENCKVLSGESVLSRRGSTMENSHDYNADQCMKDSLEECKSGMVYYTCDMAIRSNGERKMLLDSNVSRIATSNQVEEPKVTENGVSFDAYVNNSNNASEEIDAASEKKHFVVPEAKKNSLIAGLTVVDCRQEEGESYKSKIEETIEKSEASHVLVNAFEGTEMSEQCKSDLVNHERSFPLENNSSLLHIYDDHQDNLKQDKSFTVTGMLNSDWKQTNETKNFDPIIGKLDSSKLTVLSVDLVDDEAFEKEGAELTSSTATMCIEPCLNNSIFANGGYETRDSVTRLSTESNPDYPISSQMQKSPSFNLNLRNESDQIPLLHQDKSATESLPKQTSLNLIKSMHNDDYERCMLHSEEMPVEEKIVTMERSYSKKSKAPFIGLLKEDEEARLLDMAQAQDNHVGTKNAESESSTPPRSKEKRKPRSSFFSSCMCCATVP